MKKIKRIIILLLSSILLCGILTGCDELFETTTMTGSTEDGVKLTFDAVFYDNQGNNYVTFKGNEFNISPNKVKQWGYNTDGTWTSWYETSSVVSITIDGHNVQSCGSTVIFKDSRLTIDPLVPDFGTLDSSEGPGYQSEITDSALINYVALTNWWFDTHEKGQGGEKLVLIQSQDGYNIGIVEGADVTWEVAGKLPKTTLIKVDGKPLYLHRCNFTIIDTALFSSVTTE